MMNIQYKPQGVCSQLMNIQVEDGIIQDIQIIGGCDGNLQGICALIKGRRVDEVTKQLKGIRCGMKNTSCPDQLATALLSAQEK